MILGKEVSRCEEALSELNLESLSKRREDNFMSDVFSMNQVLCFRFEDLGYTRPTSICKHAQWKNSSYVCPINPESWCGDGKLINKVKKLEKF